MSKRGGLRAAPSPPDTKRRPLCPPGGAGRVGSLTHTTNSRLGPPTLPVYGHRPGLTRDRLTSARLWLSLRCRRRATP
jgi:hypothetical protein